jgi:hypothetical protein
MTSVTCETEEIFEPTYYTWTIWADALFFTRDAGSGVSLVFSDGFLGVPGNPGPEIFNGRDLTFDFRPGARIGISRCLTCTCDVEAIFFGIDSWLATASLQGPLHVSFPGFVQAFGPGTATFLNGTDLFSSELNLRHNYTDRLAFLAGFRWIELGDNLEFQFQPPAGPNATNFVIDTNNHLFGFQLGAQGTLLDGGGTWRLKGWGKAGIFYNSADQSTNVFLPAVGATADRDDTTSFAADVALMAVGQLTDRLALQLGYQLLWIDGVALAPDQLTGVNDVTVPISVLEKDGDVLFHGFFVGLEATW